MFDTRVEEEEQCKTIESEEELADWSAHLDRFGGESSRQTSVLKGSHHAGVPATSLAPGLQDALRARETLEIMSENHFDGLRAISKPVRTLPATVPASVPTPFEAGDQPKATSTCCHSDAGSASILDRQVTPT